MIAHYMKIFLRSLLKNKSFSIINIAGLSVGITCCILISMYVRYELNYDKLHEKGGRITRAIMEYSIGGSVNKGNYTSTKVGPSFKKNFPEIEEFVRLHSTRKIVRNGESVFVEKRFLYTDSTFFKLFSFKFLEGQITTALSGPDKVILTKSAARKYFGDASPVGKTLKISSAGTDYMVTGIVEDCPDNSQIKFDFLASFSSLGVTQEETYWNANYTTYLLLKDVTSISSLQKKIPGFMKTEMKDALTGGDYLTYELEPFKRIHLYSEFPGFEINGSISYVYIISLVGLLILTIACFTFVNLSTAKSVERAREIGIRKVAGAGKAQIFWQFIGESAFIIFISALLSLLACYLTLPYFNELISRNLKASELFSWPVLSYCLLIVLVISFLAGAYPSFVLSRFQPVKVLKGAFKNTGSGLWLRKSLFVFQFVVSVFLIICTLVIQKQLHFIQNKKLGYDREHVVILPYDSKVHEKYSALKIALKQNAGIIAVGKGDFEPCNIMGGYSMQKPGMLPDKSYGVFAGAIDEDYLKACGIKLIAGIGINEHDVAQVAKDDTAKKYFQFILNRSAAKQMGWSAEEAVGKKMFLDESRPGEVKGVVEDFHFSSLHNPIKPLVLFPGNYGNEIMVKLSGSGLDKSISDMEKVWRTVITHRPFEYNFLDENYSAMYKSEITLGKALNTFAALAIVLACLGLFGLSSFTIKQRFKEIGIRKVLGSSVANIVQLLSRDFLKLVAVSFVIASPIAWYGMNLWLQDYVYRISIGFWVFVLAGLLAFLIAFLTVSLQAVKAALANPVKSLRTE